jgi:hypothetical protein
MPNEKVGELFTELQGFSVVARWNRRQRRETI